MLNFQEYMASQPDFEQPPQLNFQKTIEAVKEAIREGKLEDAYNLLRKAEPRTKDEASEKAMFLLWFEDNREKFLKAINKRKGQA